ncbi:MAG: flagellar hook basal-body protein [Candidatus Solibacter usitatus]|nr:flagellar hook basal-body protein [Candidatus Solibacter usitatus]
MDLISSTAAAGMRARLEALDIVANNIANSSSPGFKADREAYHLYLGADSLEAALTLSGQPQPLAPIVELHHTDFSQGQITPTGEPTDLALNGPGFFLVDGPNGPLLSRNGRIQVTADGRLTTPQGYELATVEPRRIRLQPRLPFSVDPDGTVRQEGAALGRLRIVGLEPGLQPAKQEGVYFSLERQDPAKLASSGAEVLQGRLEAANFSPAEAAVKLVGILRQFETLQRAVQIGGEMGRRAVEEVARVNG